MTAAELGSALARWALRRPVTTCMLFLSMILLGAISSRLLPLEKFPGVDIPQIVVQVSYPNSTPVEIERLITRPLEEALATLSNVSRMRSTSTSEMGQVLLEFEWGQDIRTKTVDAREKVDAIKHLLPADAGRVVVFQFNTEDMPVFQLRISSQRDLTNAYDLLDRSLRKPIERVDGVSRVTLYGVEPQHIVIRLNRDVLLANQLDPAQVTAALQQANFSLTAGYLENEHERILVNPVGEFRSEYEIGELPIRPGLKLRDIADISREMPRKTDARHLDQSYAIGMEIFKDSNANLVEVSTRVMKVIEEIRQDPQFNGIHLFIMDDTAKGVTSSLSDLVNAGLVGALLSFIILFLFLRDIVTTLVIVLSVPIAICIALGGMYFLGYSLNILSLMGLMLAVGMLIDNAVVMTESILFEREQGATPEQATIRGVGQVSLAVITGTVTTAIVFLPNIFGQQTDLTIFLEHTAVSICISLFASLLLSQTLVPLLITKLPKLNASKPGDYQQFPRYRKALQWTLNHPGWTGTIALVLLVSIAVPLGAISGDGEGQDFGNRLYLNYQINSQYTLPEVADEVNQLETYLYANKDNFHIDSVYSYYTSNYAISTLLLKDDLPEKTTELMQRIRADLPTMLRSNPKFGFGGGRDGVQVTLSGQSTDVLQRLAQQMVPVLSQINGLTDVQTELEAGQFELVIHVDRERAYHFGLSSADVARTVATALRGQRLRSYRGDPNGEIELRVAFDRELEYSLAALYQLPVTQLEHKVVRLQDIATLVKQPQQSQIRRIDRRTALQINANLNELTLGAAREQITAVLSQLELPAGYMWSLDGSFQRQRDNENVMLMNSLLAVALIYIVMAALFESLILPTAIITSLVYSIVGVFWTLMLMGESMGIMAMIGILILMGIVVNNGIVMVDRINQLRQEGMALNEAIIEGSLNRFRPILMTVATTVAGLIPLAVGNTQFGGDGPSYTPMAIAIIGGLLFSTITSLFLVPYVYARLLGLRARWQRLIQHAQQQVNRLLPG